MAQLEYPDTIRRHWEAARKVNIKGQAVTLDLGGPLAEAAWAKQRTGRATQTVFHRDAPTVSRSPTASS